MKLRNPEHLFGLDGEIERRLAFVREELVSKEIKFEP